MSEHERYYVVCVDCLDLHFPEETVEVEVDIYLCDRCHSMRCGETFTRTWHFTGDTGIDFYV
jgi:NMD protein affecting ribosome stability and mRNA decay